MYLEQIEIKHFRSFVDEVVPLESVTALVGANGGGKSNILYALNFFYAPNVRLRPEDFYNRELSQSIEVTLVFTDLSDPEKEAFAPYINGDKLSITKVGKWNDGTPGATYHGRRTQHGAFRPIRAEQGATEKKRLYNDLREHDLYAELSAVSKAADIDVELEKWEQSHLAACEPMLDDGRFFGFTNVGIGKIDAFSRFIFVPAVRDVSEEATEAAGNALRALVDLFVKESLQNNEALAALRAESTAKYRELLSPENIDALTALSAALTRKLDPLSPGTIVNLGWSNLGEISIPTPTTTTNLTEGGFRAPVAFAGHGTQRAFLIAILQHLVEARLEAGVGEGGDAAARPRTHVFIAIEEPELYLHPLRARTMNDVLKTLAEREAGPAFQVIYATHSPYFVSLDRFSSVRLIARARPAEAGKPLVSTVTMSDLEAVATTLGVAFEKESGEYKGEALKARLTTIMTALVSEGFFSKTVVLVEGEEDRAIILSVARRMALDLAALGVSVIPVGGKSNLDRPLVIFSTLAIRTFLVFDGDADLGEGDGKPATNKALLRLCGETPEDFPDAKAFGRGACFKENMQAYVSTNAGADVFEQKLREVCDRYEIGKVKHGKKNATVLAEVLDALDVDPARLPVLRLTCPQPSVHFVSPSHADILGSTVSGAGGR